MKQSDSNSQTADLTTLLEYSVDDVADTEYLQRRICAATRDMPQNSRESSGWARSLFHPFSESRRGMALAACCLLVVVTLTASTFLWRPQSQVPIVVVDRLEESLLLNEEELSEDVFAQLIWDEVLLLEDEIAFGTL